MKSFHIKLEEKYHTKDGHSPVIDFKITKSKIIINGDETINHFSEFIKDQEMLYYMATHTGKTILVTFFDKNSAF